jgi:DNA-binding beta-propeller fold protein YncE
MPGCTVRTAERSLRGFRLASFGLRRAAMAVVAIGLCGGGVLVSGAGASAASTSSPFVVTAKIAAGPFPYGVALDPVTQKVFVSHVSSNTVSVIDAVSGKPDGVYQTGSSPGPLAVDSSLGNLLVGGYDSVSEINEASGQTIPVGVGVSPIAMAVGPDAHKVYAISATRQSIFGALIGSLSVIDETGADAGRATGWPPRRPG